MKSFEKYAGIIGSIVFGGICLVGSIWLGWLSVISIPSVMDIVMGSEYWWWSALIGASWLVNIALMLGGLQLSILFGRAAYGFFSEE